MQGNQFVTPTPQYGQYQVPQSYVNIMPNTQALPQQGIFTRFVSSEQEANAQPNPVNGCTFFVDGEHFILYAKYADGRPMETYDMVLRKPAEEEKPLTVKDLNDILDKRFEELNKKFVIRKENRGGSNG